jgi:hypothetical protein
MLSKGRVNIGSFSRLISHVHRQLGGRLSISFVQLSGQYGVMKRSFVQCAELLLEAGADPAAPGGAVTKELCGSWEHPGPCRWPHETSAMWDGRQGKVRVVFIAGAEEEQRVRALIDHALACGECVGPDGKLSRWEVSEQTVGVLNEREAAWGERITEPPHGK